MIIFLHVVLVIAIILFVALVGCLAYGVVQLWDVWCEMREIQRRPAAEEARGPRNESLGPPRRKHQCCHGHKCCYCGEAK